MKKTFEDAKAEVMTLDSDIITVSDNSVGAGGGNASGGGSFIPIP